jgi:hypothetical protein
MGGLGMTTTAISNSDDVIDSRDVIARIEELETELQDAHEGEGSRGDFREWLREADEDDKHTLQDAAHELIVLQSLAEEAEGYAPDWKYGETLIRDSYFKQYAQELADDCGMVKGDSSWPNNCIDWNEAARQLQQDYTQVDFDGVEYWIR